jgi:hypothetical protein
MLNANTDKKIDSLPKVSSKSHGICHKALVENKATHTTTIEVLTKRRDIFGLEKIIPDPRKEKSLYAAVI